MTQRDRLVISALAAIALVVVAWLGLVGPKRHDAAQLASTLSSQQARLAGARQQVAQGLAAESAYRTNLRSVRQLYRAVPANDGIPRLLVALTRTSTGKHVDFQVLQVSGGQAATASTAAAGGSGFQSLSFQFTFNGSYLDLQHFIHALDRYTLMRNGTVVARGRLLSIQSVSLNPGSGGSHRATAAITATAYSQPAATTGAPPAAVTPVTATAPAPSAAPAQAAVPAPGTATTTSVRSTR